MAELMTTNEGLILLHPSFENSEELLTTMAGLAKEQGLVDDTYLPALLERENEFPTGLELPVNISISHIATGVNRSFVSIATLEHPVMFKSMDLSDKELEVQIAFVFGILDPQSQIEILRRFAGSFSDGERIMGLVHSESEKELIDKLNVLLDNMLVIG